VVAQINQEGTAIREDLSEERIVRDGVSLDTESARSRFFDCADGIMCEPHGGGR
jgi:hypothetical protein